MTTRRRFVTAAAAVAAIVLAGVVTFAVFRSRSSERSSGSISTTTTTRTVPPPTTVPPRTIPVPPLPPAGPTTAPPPAITAPPAATAAPATTTSPGTTTPATTTTKPSPRTTTPATSTTKSSPGTTTPATSTTKPSKVTRRTVVYSPPGAPKRRGDLAVPRQHWDAIVVLVHSDDENGSKKQMRGWADFYAQHGYATFAIDYLVTKPNTPSPVYPKPETDVKAAVQYLRSRAGALGIDPDRIVVQGFSTGAALGAQAVVTPDDAYFSGPAHYSDVGDAPAAFVGFYGRYDGSRSDEAQYYGGPPDSPNPDVQQRYAKASSIAQAATAAGPALLVQGDADNEEFVGSATAFRDALQAAGKDVTLATVPGAAHDFDQSTSGVLTPEGKQVGQQVVDWLAARFPPSSS